MRIASFVPAATDTICRLGVRQSLVGVSHACGALCDLSGVNPPVLTRSRLPAGASCGVIDGAMKTAALNRNEVHVIDDKQLAALRPDLVILPADSAASETTPSWPYAALRRWLTELHPAPRPLSWAPARLAEVLGSIRAIGEAVDRGQESARLVADLKERTERVRKLTETARRKPRVALLSWVNPPIGAGGVLAEMVKLVNARPVVGDPDEPSRPLRWEHVVGVSPEVILVAPCGFSLDRARAEGRALAEVAELRETPAARWGQVHALDAGRHFSALGPTLVRGLEILATLVHPELAWPDELLPGAASRPLPID